MNLREILPFSSGNPAETPPPDPFAALHRQIDRLFSDAGRGGSALWDAGAVWNGAAPRIDVKDNDKELRITAELPGVSEQDVEVVLQDDLLTIKGEKKAEKKEEKENVYLTERSYGSFSRAIRMPFGADPDKVSAHFAKGVLTVTVPKPAETHRKTRKIAVKAGD
jgi:HSP20 family protein